MPIYALGDLEPVIHPTAYVHPDAVVIGLVTIGAESTVWPCAVLRGDNGGIEIGERTSIQDGTVIHCIPTRPTIVGDDCVVGHIVHLEGCTIESGCLVGNGSVVLHDALVRSGAVVGSNAVIPNRMEVFRPSSGPVRSRRRSSCRSQRPTTWRAASSTPPNCVASTESLD